jgi:hypothetical protein
MDAVRTSTRPQPPEPDPSASSMPSRTPGSGTPTEPGTVPSLNVTGPASASP